MEISWMQANNATRLGVLPEPSAFTVTATVGTETKNIQVVSVTLTSGYLLDLILATAITSGAVVKVSYTAPPVENPVTTTNKALQDLQGNDALSFGPLTVLNTSIVSPLPIPPAPTIIAGPENVTAKVNAPSSGTDHRHYRIYASPGNGRCDITAPSDSCIISNLTAGVSYVFVVRAFDNSGGVTASGPASAPVQALAKGAGSTTGSNTDSATNATSTASWDVEPATDSESDSNTVGFFPNPVPGNSIITNEFGFVIDKKGGIKPKIRMRSYAGRIAMTISAKYKVAGKTKNYKCTFKPFGTTKKVKSVKWRWYTPKKACILPKPLITAVQKGETTISAKGKWSRQWLTSGKKARPNRSKIKPRTLKYTMRAKPAVVK
jgi:hypothetical protein